MQIFVYVGLLIGLTPLLGIYMANVFNGKHSFLHPILGWLETLSYRFAGVNQKEEMTWPTYAKCLFVFNLLGFLFLFLLLLTQSYLPLNPEHLPATSWSLAFNTAISFTTNSSWQSYAGETTLSYLTQMLGITVQSFLSGATGLAVLLALIRGISRKTCETIGNFWVDIVRSIVYLFLPLSLIFAVVFVSEGVIQTFAPYVEITTLEKRSQKIPLGPVASQEAIKQLSGDGGGFFNANSAHPFENPTSLTNYLEMLALLLIPAASVYAFASLIGSKQHGYMIFGVMLCLFIGGLAAAFFSEQVHNPSIGVYPVLEGQETRLGMPNSILGSFAATASSDGAVNAMVSSLTPLAGGVLMINMMIGEVVFGGIGVGLCSMIIFVLLTAFMCGLMVGRTPEYFGKKIEKQEMQWVILAILVPSALALIGAGVSCVLPIALSSLSNQGPHGMSEILYAFVSSAANNGSAFAGLNTNTDYYNLSLGVVMLVARATILLSSVALAGLFAKKGIILPSLGTLSSHTPLFAVLLIGVIMIVGGLTFFSALSLGPIVEHLLMVQGQIY